MANIVQSIKMNSSSTPDTEIAEMNESNAAAGKEEGNEGRSEIGIKFDAIQDEMMSQSQEEFRNSFKTTPFKDLSKSISKMIQDSLSSKLVASSVHSDDSEESSRGRFKSKQQSHRLPVSKSGESEMKQKPAAETEQKKRSVKCDKKTDKKATVNKRKEPCPVVFCRSGMKKPDKRQLYREDINGPGISRYVPFKASERQNTEFKKSALSLVDTGPVKVRKIRRTPVKPTDMKGEYKANKSSKLRWEYSRQEGTIPSASEEHFKKYKKPPFRKVGNNYKHPCFEDISDRMLRLDKFRKLGSGSAQPGPPPPRPSQKPKGPAKNPDKRTR